MQFQSHIPNYMHFYPSIQKQEFSSIQEILNHPWIIKWKTNRSFLERLTFQYCWDTNDGKWSKSCLMATWREPQRFFKKTWWVLGYLSEIPKTLPKINYYTW